MLFSSRAPSWLVVFLGNPGDKYRGTRHNVGFRTAELITEKRGISAKRIKYKSLTGVGTLGGQKAMLMLPQTYMNLSGEAVGPAAGYYHIPPEQIIVVADDVALEPGRLRIRRKGSAGGHNGLKSIISHLGSEQFPRIKIGVGSPPHEDYDMADWVLGKPRGEELKLIDDAVARAAEAVEAIIADGADSAMNRFN